MNTSVTQDNFRFFIDNVTIEKAKDSKGNDVMKVGGIASTRDQDSDGEEIDPTGFDVDYFLKSGFLNYNHQAKFNPAAVIGEPTVAKVTKDGLYVEGFLYPESELAKNVYNTTQMLNKSSSSRRMGFSIEGKALERDPFDEKKIKKARVTGMALTLNPKNPNTLVNIIKGEYHNDDFEYDTENLPKAVKNSLEKAENFIIHLERDGKLVQVDRDLNIRITEKNSGEVEKSLSTASGAAMIPESVDQDVKESERLPKVRNLTKGQVYSEIFNYIYIDDLEKADMVYQLIQKVAEKRSKMENTNKEVTTDDIQKALDALDVILGKEDSNEDTLFKGMDSDEGDNGKKRDDDEVDNQEEVGSQEEVDEEEENLRKGMEESKKAFEDYQKSKVKKSEVDTDIEKSEGSDVVGGTIKPPSKEEIEKGVDITELMNQFKSEISNTLEKSIDGTNNLIKSLGEATQGLLQHNIQLEESLNNSNSTVSELQKSLDGAMERLEKVERTPIPSRTVTSNNYKQHPTLEKSEDGGQQLHIVNNKHQILELLDKASALDTATPNMRMAGAMQAFESSGQLDKSIISDLQKSEGVEIIM